jgi:phosphoribosylformimino-5-aminoimidazole carboxamide ribotide isomerase
VDDGVKTAICTDIVMDGMLKGPSLDTYGKIRGAFPGLFLVASGGIATMKDIASLDEMGIPAVIVGKAIYEERILLKELENYILKRS